MRPEFEEVLVEVANRFAVPDAARPGEWKCQVCGGQTLPDGPIIHTPSCALTVLHEVMEPRS